MYIQSNILVHLHYQCCNGNVEMQQLVTFILLCYICHCQQCKNWKCCNGNVTVCSLL